MSGWSRFIKRVCQQDAVYWGAPVSNGMGGQTFNTPVEIKVRWEDEIALVSSIGEEIETTKSTITARIIYSELLALNGYLFLGGLADITGGNTNPVIIQGAFKIIDKRRVPLLGGRDFIYEHMV